MIMKLRSFFVMLLSALCITFTSCDKDDDDDKTVDYATEIAGTYKGDVFLGPSETPVAPGATITFTRIDVNKVTLTMNETIANLPINVTCESDVVYSNNTYRISGTTQFEMGGAALPVNVEGTIDKDGNADINIAIPLASIDVVYKGKKQ